MQNVKHKVPDRKIEDYINTVSMLPHASAWLLLFLEALRPWHSFAVGLGAPA